MAKAAPKVTKQAKLHIRKGDNVRVLSGKDRGKEGRVMAIVKKTNRYNNEVQYRAIVEGLNMVTKNNRPDEKNPQGSVIQVEASLHVSKLMLVEPKTGKPVRIGRKKTDNGWVRVSKKSGEIIK